MGGDSPAAVWGEGKWGACTPESTIFSRFEEDAQMQSGRTQVMRPNVIARKKTNFSNNAESSHIMQRERCQDAFEPDA